MKIRQFSQHGFTIIELMIATAVFSVVLLLCASGLIAVGRMYQKGNTNRTTQEVARSLMDRIQKDFELSGGYYSDQTPVGTPANGVHYFCIGDNLYTYQPDRQIVPGTVDHAFVVTTPSSGCLSSPPEDLTNTGAQELLGPRMRVAEFSITPLATSPNGVTAVSIKINVVSGGTDLLNAAHTNCQGGAGQEFCASSTLVSTATRRLK